MMPDQVRKWLRYVRRLLCCGCRRTGKAMAQVYQCWWRICREINVFPRFEYHTFYVLYPFVTYVLTLPRILRFIKYSFCEVSMYIYHQYFVTVLTFMCNNGIFTSKYQIQMQIATWIFQYTGSISENLPYTIRPVRREGHTQLGSARTVFPDSWIADRRIASTHYNSCSMSPQ
jgi:hypothetical protein